VPATASTDTTQPISTITSLAPGTSVADGTQMAISGTATDAGHGVVAGVEVSTDDGQSWHPAQGTNNWTYAWTANRVPSTTILSRAVDDSGNLETPSDPTTVSTTCPCSLWANATPSQADSGDPKSAEVGMKFTTDVGGLVSAIRYYKTDTNTGPHVGDVWSASGALMSRVTFTAETSSGWQQATLSQPVFLEPNTTYVVSVFDPVGHYSDTPAWFYPPPSPPPTGGGFIDAPPLHALRATGSVQNGVFAYAKTPTFPNTSFNAANYWVDVVFAPGADPGSGSGSGSGTGTGTGTGTGSATGTSRPPSGGRSGTPKTGSPSTVHPPAVLSFRVTAFGESSLHWVRGPRHPARHAGKSHPNGTRFGFTLNRRAKVSLIFTAKTLGMLRGGRCVAAPKGRVAVHPCSRFAKAGQLALGSLAPGAHVVPFSGWLTSRRRLAPDTYTVTLRATDEAREAATAGPISFVITS
jgi:hypothetical protein